MNIGFNVRLIAYCIATFGTVLIFLFVPNFNWSEGAAHMSLYDQYLKTGHLFELLKQVAVPAVFTFVGLSFLFGFGKSKRPK